MIVWAHVEWYMKSASKIWANVFLSALKNIYFSSILFMNKIYAYDIVL